nr:ABC transporter ATP-binding protein [Micromonospora sp. DSM 115978]
MSKATLIRPVASPAQPAGPTVPAEAPERALLRTARAGNRALRTWALFVGAAAGLAELALPATVGAAVAAIQRDVPAMTALLPVVAALAVMSVLAAFRTWAMDVLSAREIAVVRTTVLTHISRLPAPALENAGQGELVGRFDSDVDAVEHLLSRARLQWGLAGMTASLTFGLMVVVNPWLVLTVLGCLLVSGALVAVTLMPVRSVAGRGLAAKAALVTDLSDFLRHPRTIKVYGLESRYLGRFQTHIAQTRGAEQRIGRAQATVDGIVRLASYGSILIVVGIGAAMVASGATTWPELSAFVVALTVMAAPLAQIARLAQDRQRARAAAGRLREVLVLAPEAQRTVSATTIGPPLSATADRVTFDGVGVRLADRWVVRDVSFTAAAGEVLCLRGPSGSGKSTLLSLIPRMIAASAGTVSVRGRSVEEWSLTKLRRQISFVEQDSPFLGRTLRECLAPDSASVPDQRVHDVLGHLGVSHLAEGPGGLDTPLNRHGTSVSGGERQRLAIARAIISGRPICLLDEPTAHLDAANERVILAAVGHLMAGQIVIVASHSTAVASLANAVIDLAGSREDPVP